MATRQALFYEYRRYFVPIGFHRRFYDQKIPLYMLTSPLSVLYTCIEIFNCQKIFKFEK